jgi:4-oxalocrotonate tautomerase
MPYLNCKLCAPASSTTFEQIAAMLTDLTVDVLGKKRELTAVAIEPLPPAQWFVGGTTLTGQSLASFYLDIKVTEGTNTKAEKARYVEQVFAALETLLGTLATSYIVIHEVHADAWGYQGQTQEFRYIRGKAL